MVKKTQLRKLIKKSLLVGVGVAAHAHEIRKKAEKVVKGLVKEGGINPAEGKKLVGAIYQEADKSRKRIVSVIEKEVKGLLKSAVKSSKKIKKKQIKSSRKAKKLWISKKSKGLETSKKSQRKRVKKKKKK